MSAPGRKELSPAATLFAMRSISRHLGAWITLAVLLVAGSAAMAISASSGSGGTPGVPSIGLGSKAATAQRQSGYIFGLDYADQLPEETAAAVESGVGDAPAVGAGWIRIDLAWYRVQPSADSWNWSSFDRSVAAAKAHGLKVLAILDQPPAWARAADCVRQQWCPPADATQFAAFAAKAAQRYPAGEVGGWEVWNEENLAAYWPGGPDPAGYGALLRATSTALHAIQPSARVVLGGLALAGTDGISTSPADFLAGVGKAGDLSYADAIGYHLYTYPNPPGGTSAFTDIDKGSDSLVAVLQRYKAGSTPIWITEAGAPVYDAAEDPDAAQPATQAQEQAQAAYATELVAAATSDPHVKALFWFSDIDLPAQQLYFGLRRADGTARPALTALQSAIAAYQNSHS
jgi:hypothetical protein